MNKNSTKVKHNQGMNETEMRLERLGVRRVERDIENNMKERAEIDGRSRRDREQKHKKSDENTEQSRNRRDKGHIPGD